MAATLRGKSQPERPYLYREFPSYGGQQTIRVGDWKAVRQNMAKGNLKVELYNIAEDIGETHNVADQHPEIVKELTRKMESVRSPSEIFPLIPLDKPSPQPQPQGGTGKS
jgi:arylsulfatase A-like enzyme